MRPFGPDNSQHLLNPACRPGLETMGSACLGLVLLEVESVLLSEQNLFTPREADRAAGLGSRRRRGFTAARAALKTLARQLDLVERNLPDRDIETLGPDRIKPCLAGSPLCCSVSHTARFVVAVAHEVPVGVDMEEVSGKALRAWRIFMSPSGRKLLSSPIDSPEQRATRAWTIKEAAAKAFDLGLEKAIEEVEVAAMGEEESLIRYRQNLYPVRHWEGDGHILSLITRGGS